MSKNKIIESKDRTIVDMRHRLGYYENRNSPPSSDSLESKRIKRQGCSSIRRGR